MIAAPLLFHREIRRRIMRKYMGMIVMLVLWIGLTIGAKVWFSIHPELSELNLIISACYMLFLLAIIPIGLPLHSRALEVILMLYALGLGVLDVATFLRADHILVKMIGSLLLAPFHGLFYFERYIGLGSFAIYAIIGCFAAFLVLAAGVGACMVQERE